MKRFASLALALALMAALACPANAAGLAAGATAVYDAGAADATPQTRVISGYLSTADMDKQVEKVQSSGSYLKDDARSMLAKINALRNGNGGKDAWYWNESDTAKVKLKNVPDLAYDYGLEQIAMRRAAELVINYAHVRPDGSLCFSATYEGCQTWAENIGYGTDWYVGTDRMFNAWAEEDEPYAGQGHRRNMLDPALRAVGIACFHYGGYNFWVQEFGYEPSGLVAYDCVAPRISNVCYDGGVKISWGKVSGAAKYRVFYRTGSGSWTKIADTTATSYTWKGAKAGTAYAFTVRCLSKDGKSYTSNYDHNGVQFTCCATPKNIKAAKAASGVSISWGKVAGAAKYRVFYRTGSGKWTKIADTTATSYTWKKAQAGMPYAFTVRCLSKDGKSYTSNYNKTGAAFTLYLATPAAPKVSNASNGVKLSWGKVSGAAKYRVFYRTGSGSWTKIADTTATSYTWKGAKPGTKYAFTVRCLSADGKNYASAFNKAGTTTTFYLATPAAPDVRNVSNGIKLSWNKVSGAAKYRVFYRTGSGSWKKLADTTATAYTWKGAKTGTKYTFTVRCLSANGKAYTSDYDSAGTAITRSTNRVDRFPAPKAPVLEKAGNSIKISWGRISGAAKYRVFYRTKGSGWKKLADTTATSYTWKKAKANTAYTFTVRCLTPDGKNYTSGYDPAGSTLDAKGNLPTPAAPTLTKTAEGIQIRWRAVNGAAQYRVFYRTGNGKWTKLADTAATSCVWSGAKAGVKYTFTVRCLAKDGKAYTSSYDAKGSSISGK